MNRIEPLLRWFYAICFFGENRMNNEIRIDLPESPYQCRADFTLKQDNRGWFSWIGAGRFEDDHCAFESFRTIDQAAADALFRLAIADGQDSSEALLTVFSAGLPTDHLDLDDIDYP
jgi:hypothetical protein